MLPTATSSCPLPIRSQNSFDPQARQKPRLMPGEDFEPGEVAVALDLVALRRRQSVDAQRAVMAAALAAVAGRGRGQRPLDLVTDGAAEAAAARLAPAHASTVVAGGGDAAADMECGNCSSPSVISSKSAFSATKM